LNEITRIQEIIKFSLKASGLQYQDLAIKLKISLPSVKRMLNGKDIPLTKIIEVSSCLGIDVFDLLEQARNYQPTVYEFTLEQENALSEDFTHFLAFRLMLMSIPVHEIQERLSLKRPELNKILKLLEKFKLIEVWPNDRIKTLVHFPFKWIENGPLDKTYQKKISKKVQKEISLRGINRRKERNGESHCLVKELLLTPDEGQQFDQELETVFKKYFTLTNMRMRHKTKVAETYSFMHLAGKFSWWDE
jgi:transcriptional regulator with XRE-family HTH domain